MDPRSPAMYVFIAGLVLFAFGVTVLGHACVPQSGTGTLTIPAGQFFWTDTWSVTAGGSAEVDYAVTSGGPITVYVMSASDYLLFSSGQQYGAVSSGGGAAGTLSADVPGFGAYYVVITHDPGDVGSAQTVSVIWLLTGVDPLGFFSGFALGLIGAYVGLRGRTRFSPSARRPRPSTEAALRASSVGPPEPVAPAATPEGPPSATLVVVVENPSPVEEVVHLRVNGTDFGSVQVPARAVGRANITLSLPSKFGASATVDAVRKDGRSTRRDVFIRAWDVTRLELRLD